MYIPCFLLILQSEKKLVWDEETRLQSIYTNGFISGYWYDASGERVVKTSGDDEGVYVNDVFSGARTSTDNFTAYVNPYMVVSKGGSYTKHIYIGSQRIVSKLGDLDSYGQDPRRIEYAGSNVDGASVNYKAKYTASQQAIRNNYAAFEVPYYGTDNDNYVDGKGFCCNDAPTLRSGAIGNGNDNPELFQYYYHSEHLGSSSLITNLDGDVVQHVEYVPFGEVFIEERNNTWNTPYLFNAKELDEETGLYYYGARYYDPRISLWLSIDKPLIDGTYLSGKHNGGVFNNKNLNGYAYCYQNPILLVDPDGNQTLSSFIIGKPTRPNFQYDAGFSKFPKESPTWEDRKNYAKWYVKGLVAANYPPLMDAGLAYWYYMNGTGSNKTFDLREYLKNDPSGKIMLKNAISIAKSAAQNLLVNHTTITSEGFSVGGTDGRFPYPATENWQKTVGAFNFWMSADVSISPQEDGNLKYTMNLTIHAEDMYNFNPGQADIATGTPDDVNGRFEVVGWAKQYMNYGEYTTKESWTAPASEAQKTKIKKETR